MNPSKQFLILGLWAVGAAALSAATTIYSDTFSWSGSGSSGDLNATSVETGTGTWAAETNWKRNSSGAPVVNQATHTTDANGNAFLDFTPTIGKLYTLTMDVNITNETDGWVALGFTDETTTGSSFYNLSSASARVLLRGNKGDGSGTSEIRLGSGESGGNYEIATTTAEASDTPTFDTLKIELDTRGGGFWTTTWSISEGATGTFQELKEYTYTSNPTINYVGFGKGYGSGHFASAEVQNFSLTEVPEPTNVVFSGGLCLMGLLLGHRRRRS